MIEFGSPQAFLLGFVVLAMAGCLWYIVRWRRQARESFAGPQARRWPGAAFLPRYVLLLGAAVLIVLAAARPQWGNLEQVRDREGIDFVIVLDISLSMTAEDVAPTRLAVAQDEIASVIESQRGSRIGLVFFAGNAIIRSPLSTDTAGLAQIVRRADRELGIVQPGSDLGAALEVAASILTESEAAARAILLVSDGEDHPGTYMQSAQALAEEGIAIFTAGVGTSEGSQIYREAPFGDTRTLILDQAGQPVITYLHEESLQQIASLAGGYYTRLQAGENSLLGLQNDLRQMEQTAITADRQIIPIERFQLFVAAAVGLLIASWFLPGRLPRPALPRLRRTGHRPGLALLLLALLIGGCATSDALRERNEAANTLYYAEEYEDALASYRELLIERPDIDQLSYNAGNTLHRMGAFDRAVTETQRALPPSDPAFGSTTYYALGNHLLMLERLQEAYNAYRSALLLDPNDRSAKHNLELTLLLMEQHAMPPEEGPGPGDQPNGPGEEPPPGEEGPDEGVPEPGDDPGEETPEPNGPAEPNGEPADEQTPGDTMSPQRALEEALAGIDEELSFEDAVRILDLLREQVQRPILPGQTADDAPAY